MSICVCVSACMYVCMSVAILAQALCTSIPWRLAIVTMHASALLFEGGQAPRTSELQHD